MSAFQLRAAGLGSYPSNGEYKEAVESPLTTNLKRFSTLASPAVKEGKGNGGYACGGCGRGHSRVLSYVQPHGAAVSVTLVSLAITLEDITSYSVSCLHAELSVLSLLQVDLRLPMCVNEIVNGKTRQIFIDKIDKQLLPDQVTLMDVSSITFMLFVKSLDNALRVRRGGTPTSTFTMGAFAQKRQAIYGDRNRLGPREGPWRS